MDLPVDYTLLHWTEKRTVREEYVRLQEGACHHCKAALDGPPAPKVAKKWVNPRLFPANFFRYPVHLHHDHNTGMTIGAVHNHCNAVLWQYYGE